MNDRRRLPPLQSLSTFEMAARARNFSRAAQALNVTQPAVSHAVAGLERLLGRKLFARQGARISLTADGERLRDVVAKSLDQIEELMNAFDREDGKRQAVVLSISSGLATHWLMPRYADFHQNFPDINLQLQLIPGSVGGPLSGCDLGLRASTGHDHGIGGYFAPECVLTVCSPTYYERRGPLECADGKHTLVDLKGYWLDWSEYSKRFGLNAALSQNHLSFGDYSVVVQTALCGQGIALGWTSVISKLLIDGMLVKASDHMIKTDIRYHLVASGDAAERPVVFAVRDWLIAEMQREQQCLKALGIQT